MTVIAAVELDDLVAFGEATREADGAHAGFRAGVWSCALLHAGTSEQMSFAIVTIAGFGMPKLVP